MIFRVHCTQFVLIFSKLQANLDDTCGRRVKLDCPMYSKQKTLEGAYSWTKMWSLKVLAILKCENKTSVHAVQYK